MKWSAIDIFQNSLNKVIFCFFGKVEFNVLALLKKRARDNKLAWSSNSQFFYKPTTTGVRKQFSKVRKNYLLHGQDLISIVF